MRPTAEHLVAVARCPVIEATLNGQDTPCSKIINFQATNHSGRYSEKPWSDRFQVPTPWVGRLDEAPILFIGANPSTGFVEDYPDRSASEAELIDAFQFAYSSPRQWIKDGVKQRHIDGGYSSAVAFWSSVRARAKELMGGSDTR